MIYMIFSLDCWISKVMELGMVLHSVHMEQHSTVSSIVELSLELRKTEK